MEFKRKIIIKGARENNLKNIDLILPKEKLIVFTGVSGSGKSSLAFNTIYEEGRRRYVESLSSYARQFLGNTQKPLVDSIEGLSPAISIEQKTIHSNPRSTVGTVTEIYDYLRLLYARIGTPFCPKHKKPVAGQKMQDIITSVFQNPINSKIYVYAPLVKKGKGTHINLFETLRVEGFSRIKVNGKIFNLDDEIKLDKNKRHDIAILIDRTILNKTNETEIIDAIEVGLEYGKGIIEVEVENQSEIVIYSKHLACSNGDFDMPLIEPKLFSFNSPVGMCNSCKGIGIKLKVDPKILIPNRRKTILEGAIIYFANLIESENIDWQKFVSLLKHYQIKMNVPIENLTKEELEIIFYGSHEPISYKIVTRSGNNYHKTEYIEGIAGLIERRYLETNSETNRRWYKIYMTDIVCETCQGTRLNKYALAVQVDGININQFSQLSINEAITKIKSLQLNQEQQQISELIIKELRQRLNFLINVGLTYLSLSRKAATLSGGEAQRIRLATQIGSNLTGVLYVLDEPSIGLHQADNNKLIKTLKNMVAIGNTLIVVEHDEATIKQSDHIVDIGILAGDEGGEIVAQGDLQQIMQTPNSITGQFLNQKRSIDIPKTRRSGNGKLVTIKKVYQNNLKKITVKFPLGKFIVITGVSGSGKSTLVSQVLAKVLDENLKKQNFSDLKYDKIEGVEFVDKLVRISQTPIGRTPRSNLATYTSVFDNIRDLYALTIEARARGYTKSRFSFNVDGGRCDKCYGDGTIKIAMHFLPDVYIKCNHCQGKRFNSETLEVKFKTKNIFDILNMRVSEAINFFEDFAKIKSKLQILVNIGLNYVKLGQSATTLSGGEAQRIKLATHLQKKPTGKTFYILDEPTIGLHSYDVKKLLQVINSIVDHGDTVVLIEHNFDVIKSADYIIDLGPGGGTAGGQVIATGTPEQIAQNSISITGKFLKDVLKI